jgi:shikimate kinase
MYITGFMGSGKSTIGPLLAGSLAYRFVDLDLAVAAREGKDIPAIFRERGESEFRAMERDELLRLSTESGIVVATGGGTLGDPGSLAIVRGSGALVYLEVSPETLITRLRGMRGRPMIAADDGAPLDDQRLRGRIDALLLVREPVYRLADITVDAGSRTPGEIVASILESLRSLRKPS